MQNCWHRRRPWIISPILILGFLVLHSLTHESNLLFRLQKPSTRCNAAVPSENETSLHPYIPSSRNEVSGLALIGTFNHRRDVFKKSLEQVNATFEYIQQWYDTLHNFPSMRGIVLHNMFTPQQTGAWTTDQVHFIHIDNRTHSFQKGLRRPINDMRFIVILDFLKALMRVDQQEVATRQTKLPFDLVSLPSYVLISDSYDVRFLRNPFDYMHTNDDQFLFGTNHLYIGEEFPYNARKRFWDHWMNKSSTKCFGEPLRHAARMINCGLIGGHRSVVLPLLERLVDKLQSATDHQICDQISLHYILQKHYPNQFISGYPFNALFNQYQTTNETAAYIAHK